jgi:hypothetical protein
VRVGLLYVDDEDDEDALAVCLGRPLASVLPPLICLPAPYSPWET